MTEPSEPSEPSGPAEPSEPEGPNGPEGPSGPNGGSPSAESGQPSAATGPRDAGTSASGGPAGQGGRPEPSSTEPAQSGSADDGGEGSGRPTAVSPAAASGGEPTGAAQSGSADAVDGGAADPARGEDAAAQPQAPVGWLPRGAEEIFGQGATAEEAYALLTVDVPATGWIEALAAARDELGCSYFDWLSAVDEPGTGFQVCAHLAALPQRPAPGAAPGPAPGPASGEGGASGLRRLIVRTTVPHEAPVLPTATGVYAGAGWHERETHEMFGVRFTDHPHLAPLLLPDTFEGHPLRKDFVLAARVVKAWPGAKEPGESGHGGPKRRQMLPPGVPDPNEWGPLKGTLPPVPARPARGRAAAGGDRPARRARGAGAAGEGSASEQPAAGDEPEQPAAEPRPQRRARSAGQGSASQRQRSTDAPWHQAEPADRPQTEGDTATGEDEEGRG